MPIQGSIEEAGLPDVLQLLALGRKTGCLALVDGATHGEIYLDAGKISYATVANRLERLGEVLVKSGRITQAQLKEATEEQARGSKRQIGKILVESGRIDREELERFVGLQVEEAVYFLFTWKQGTFTFTSDRRPPHEPLPNALDAEGLLLEGARRVDEWSLIEKKIPSFDLIYKRSKEKVSGAAAEELTYPQQRILPLLDGTRDVAGLVDVTGMGEFDVGKALYGLVTAGFAQLVDRRAHVRHLEYRELLAYVVREAEFADPQRRKDAGRHIVDCPTCADRLRTIQVRRTEGSGVFTAAAVDRETGAEVTAAAVQPQRAAPVVRHAAPAAPGLAERRAADRRTGRDRRQFDRRAGLDRRLAVNGSWEQFNSERRMRPRRASDGSGIQMRGRRSGDSERRGGAPAAPAPDVRSSGPGHRLTEPRQHRPFERRGRDRPHPVAPELDFEETEEIPSVAADVEESTATEEAAAPAPAKRQTPPGAPPRAKRVSSPPASARTGRPSTDLEWIVTPHESLEMIRASKSQLPPTGAGARVPAKPAAAAPKPVVAAPKPAGDIQPPEPIRRSAAMSPVVATGAVRPVEAPTYEPFRAGLDEAWLADGERGSGRAAGGKAFPARKLAIAAGIAGVALLGYLAGQRGGRGRSDQTADTGAASGLTLSAEAQAPPRTRGRASEQRVTSPAAPVQSAARITAPVERRTPAQPAANPAAPPAARPVADSRTPLQERAQRAAPVPVAAAAQPPAAPARVETPAPPPAPTVGVIRGAVHDASGKTLAGARVSLRGTALSAVTDGSGAFEIREVPDGPVVVQAAADGYVAGSTDARAKAGATVAADVTLSRAATATEPDRELAAGGWAPVDRDGATSTLGGTLGAIEGLTIESISQSTAGSRPRVRVVQLTQSGERIALTETRAGAAVRGGSGPAVVTALRVMPPSEAYPFSTGTASLGNVLITVKSSLAADVLRSLLAKLGDATQGR